MSTPSKDFSSGIQTALQISWRQDEHVLWPLQRCWWPCEPTSKEKQLKPLPKNVNINSYTDTLEQHKLFQQACPS